MTVGVLQLELSIADAMSLKDKRRVVKSLKDRIAHGHNVSIAEVGALDEHRRSILGVAMVQQRQPLRRGRAEQAGRLRAGCAAGELDGLPDRVVVSRDEAR